MLSQSLNTAELSAPLPGWAVVVSLALFVVITAILVIAPPAPPAGDDHATPSAVIPYYE